MNEPTSLDFTLSVNLLERIVPTGRWPEVLLKNIHGLTPDISPTPYEAEGREMAFDTADLKALALNFARGEISQEHINSIEGEFMEELNAYEDEANNNLVCIPFEDFKVKHEVEITDENHLVLIGYAERLESIMNSQYALARAVEAIALAIKTLEPNEDGSENEIAALKNVAAEAAQQAIEVADDLDLLHNHMCFEHYHGASDAVLEAMVAELAGAV